MCLKTGDSLAEDQLFQDAAMKVGRLKTARKNEGWFEDG